MTFGVKWLLPIAVIGALVLATIVGLSSDTPSPAIVIFPVMALSVKGLAAGSIWSFVDEVIDRGDSLVFRKGRTEQIVKFRDIVNVSAESTSIPKKISIVSRTSGPLGKVLTFGAPEWLSHGEPPAILGELQSRISLEKSSDNGI